MSDQPLIPAGIELAIPALITPGEQGIASRVLARAAGGTVTLFAFAAGHGLREHSTPFDVLVLVLEGALNLTIGGAVTAARAGTIVRLPAHIPHAVHAVDATRMLLTVLRDAD